MKVTFFLKYSNFYVALKNAIKFAENFMVLNIIAFELVARVSVNYDKNAWERPSRCEKLVLRFYIPLRVMIHNSVFLILMEH